jgi:hypothetical protein
MTNSIPLEQEASLAGSRSFGQRGTPIAAAGLSRYALPGHCCIAFREKIVLSDNHVRHDVIQRRSFVVLPLGQGDNAMTDLYYRLDRFETLADECELIAKLATDSAKRELYLRLALHYRELVSDMRTAIATKDAA